MKLYTVLHHSDYDGSFLVGIGLSREEAEEIKAKYCKMLKITSEKGKRDIDIYEEESGEVRYS